MKQTHSQLSLPYEEFQLVSNPLKSGHKQKNGNINKLEPMDKPIHDWYRFVLSYPPHFVRKYIADFELTSESTILDPFCGTGTTLVESKLHHIMGIGVEANPFAHFASTVKLNWEVEPEKLLQNSQKISEEAIAELEKQGINDNAFFENLSSKKIVLKKLDSDANKLLLNDSISPLPLHKTLVLLDLLKKHQGEPHFNHLLLALAKALVFKISNLRFGPEVGVGKKKSDVPVIESWLSEVRRISDDLRKVHGHPYPSSKVHLGDVRQINQWMEPKSIDAVITSPPYPNEKDYTRTTRLESVILEFISDIRELRNFKKTLIRSNTRGVYKDDDDDKWISQHPEILEIAEKIEQRRLELGKTSGFEKLYPKVTRLYFGGMAHHLAELRTVLRPGARLAYVVGDQASYLRVMIRTGKLLAQIAQSLGYDLVRVDLFRTRFATATGEQLREEVVILRWPG